MEVAAVHLKKPSTGKYKSRKVALSLCDYVSHTQSGERSTL
jgi:hypothetical protein